MSSAVCVWTDREENTTCRKHNMNLREKRRKLLHSVGLNPRLRPQFSSTSGFNCSFHQPFITTASKEKSESNLSLSWNFRWVFKFFRTDHSLVATMRSNLPPGHGKKPVTQCLSASAAPFYAKIQELACSLAKFSMNANWSRPACERVSFFGSAK